MPASEALCIFRAAIILTTEIFFECQFETTE